MSTTTPRNGLIKPAGNDIGFASITNANMDIIDGGISKCNFYSASAPTASDDRTKGYSMGSLWVKSNSDIYVCVSHTAGAAVWRKIYPADVVPDGWIPAGETWTYASAASPTFTFTISGDKTTKYYPGMRLKLTHSSTTKYFIVTKVSYSSPNTTVTIYGGTDYSLASGAITNPYYSMMKAPAGFPLSPDKWTVTVTNATQLTKSTPTADQWYNLGVSIDIPIGVWMVEYGALMQVMRSTADWCNVYSTFSTTTNSVTDGTTTIKVGGKDGIANSQTVIKPNIFRSLTSKTTYYLLIMTDWTNVNEIEFRGDQQTTYIKAVCAYL